MVKKGTAREGQKKRLNKIVMKEPVDKGKKQCSFLRGKGKEMESPAQSSQQQKERITGCALQQET